MVGSVYLSRVCVGVITVSAVMVFYLVFSMKGNIVLLLLSQQGSRSLEAWYQGSKDVVISSSSDGEESKNVVGISVKLNESLAKVKETPVKVVGVPVKVNESPAKVNDSPPKVNESPAKVIGAPGKVSEKPTKVNDSPANFSEKPAEVNDSPAKVKENSVKVNDSPAKVSEKPAKVNDSPAKVKENPVKVNDSPAKVVGVPAKVSENHAKVVGVPAKVSENPAKVNDSPAKVNGVTEKPLPTKLDDVLLQEARCRCPESTPLPGTCGKSSETRQVVFVKVHKAASSTVQNILLRFAMARDLSALLPINGPIISQDSKAIPRARMIPQVQGKQIYDILCSHVVYDSDQVGQYFAETAFRVAIIREPMKQVLSALAYYTLVFPSPPLVAGAQKHKSDPINGFLRHPEDYTGGQKCPQPTSFVNTRMSFDLGFNVGHIEATRQNRAEIKQFLQNIEEEFDLVLISDYFDESMVLLKRQLKWSLRDILYLRVNAMTLAKDSPWRSEPNITSAEFLAFRHCNMVDYELYDHFLPIFLDKIDKEYLFEEEVAAFKSVLKSLVNFCDSESAGERLLVPKSDWTEELVILRCECEMMRLSEPSLVDRARKKQMKLHKEYMATHP